MEKLGLMTEQGLNCVSDKPLEIQPQVMSALKADPQVYENYLAFPELYRRVRIDSMQDALRTNDRLFHERLEKFVLYIK